MNRRALYNSLRMNWVLNPTLTVEAWQVEDYRSLPIDLLFERLEDKGIHLDKSAFVIFADAVDSPEELADSLSDDLIADNKERDQIYLIVFELWRRLLPEKPCISVLCDEIDHQIHLYDRGELDSIEPIQDVLANLQVVLDENSDAGTDPLEAFSYVTHLCANDLEAFLYDFIADQIDHDNFSYASDLLEGFDDYISDHRWFDFLKARVLAVHETEESEELIQRLVHEAKNKSDLDFNLELLSFLVRAGDQSTFEVLAKKTIPLLETEEDFRILLSISADFYHRLDKEKVEQAIQHLLEQRKRRQGEASFDPQDPSIKVFQSILRDAK